MDINTVRNVPLFRSMSEEEIRDACGMLSASHKRYDKGSTILHAGSTTDRMGIVLEGSVTVENNDVWGNRTILSHIGKEQFFAETYGLFAEEPLLVDVVANEDARILFIRIGTLLSLIAEQSFRTENIGQPSWIMKFVANLLMISAQKNLMLSGRSLHTSPKTIRGRVMSYLNSVSIQNGSDSFSIPFDRQQMADYLNLDRTALSKELGRMQRDGLITFNKNHFTLLVSAENY